jgi:hypothetical protein
METILFMEITLQIIIFFDVPSIHWFLENQKLFYCKYIVKTLKGQQRQKQFLHDVQCINNHIAL